MSQLKLAILRYASNHFPDASVAFAILGYELGAGAFVDTRFLHTWEPLLRLDAQADVEMLSALRDEIQSEWPDARKRTMLLYIFTTSFSNSVLVQETSCVTDDPKAEMDNLAQRYFGTHS
jgi:hypothetical protein